MGAERSRSGAITSNWDGRRIRYPRSSSGRDYGWSPRVLSYVLIPLKFFLRRRGRRSKGEVSNLTVPHSHDWMASRPVRAYLAYLTSHDSEQKPSRLRCPDDLSMAMPLDFKV